MRMPKLAPVENSWWLRLWWVWPLAAAVAVYANTLGHDFVWDDFYLILEDHTVKSFKYLGVVFSSDFFGHQENDLAYGYYRPLVSLSYALDFAGWQRNAFGYHLTNLLLHTGATVLAGALLVLMGQSRTTALFAALFFAVHPIHTENTAWISGRTDILAFLFAGGAMWVHLYLEKQSSMSGVRGAGLRGLALLLFFAALLCKEMSVVLIPWIAVASVYFMAQKKRRAVTATLPYAAVVGIYLVLRFVIADVPGPGQRPDITVFDRIAAAPWTAARYLAWLVFPIQQSAYVQNPYMTGPGDYRFYVGIVVVAGLMYTAVRFRKQMPSAAAFFWMFAVSLVPILNVVSASGPADMGAVMAERFLYFPSFPFAALAVVLVRRAVDGARPGAKIRLAVPAAGLLVLSAFGTAAVLRNRVWRNNEIFYRATLDTVASPLILCNLANHYIHTRQLDKAEKTLVQARQLTSDDYHFLSSKALLYVVRKQYKEAIGLQAQVAKKAKRGRAAAYNNLAFLYRVTGDYKRAAALLREVIDNGRGYADVYFNLAEVYRAEGRAAAAAAAYQKALERRPDSLQMIAAYAGMLIEIGDLRGAAAVFEAALELYREDPGLLNNLGVVYKKMNRPDRARALFARALEVDAGYVKARLNLAGALIALNLQSEAWDHLQRIVQTNPEGAEATAAQKLMTELRNGPSPGRPGGEMNNAAEK